MAYLIIPMPGWVTGPCEMKCSHSDCAENRRLASQVCRRCGDLTGYGVQLCNHPDTPGRLMHFSCRLEEIDILDSDCHGCGHCDDCDARILEASTKEDR